MAVEKLSDGIRKFAADAVKLERMLTVRAGFRVAVGRGRGAASSPECAPAHRPAAPRNECSAQRTANSAAPRRERRAAPTTGSWALNCTRLLRNPAFSTNWSGDESQIPDCQILLGTLKPSLFPPGASFPTPTAAWAGRGGLEARAPPGPQAGVTDPRLVEGPLLGGDLDTGLAPPECLLCARSPHWPPGHARGVGREGARPLWKLLRASWVCRCPSQALPPVSVPPALGLR